MSEDAYLEEAHSRGVTAAETAASWAADGNTDAAHRRRVLAMIEEGDPEVDDFLPRSPNLSGMFSEDATPLSLAREITGEEDPEEELVSAIADAFEAGVDDTFQDACQRELRRGLSDDAEGPVISEPSLESVVATIERIRRDDSDFLTVDTVCAHTLCSPERARVALVQVMGETWASYQGV